MITSKFVKNGGWWPMFPIIFLTHGWWGGAIDFFILLPFQFGCLMINMKMSFNTSDEEYQEAVLKSWARYHILGMNYIWNVYVLSLYHWFTK